MTDAYSVGQLLGNRIAQTPPPGDASNRVATTQFVSALPINPVLYGADPSGVADSSAAFNNALAALPAAGGLIYFPPGKFKFNSQISYTLLGTLQSVVIEGSGIDSTILTWPSTGGGMQFNLSSAQHTVHCRNLTLTTSQAAGGTALGISNSSSLGNFPGCEISNVTICGEDRTALSNYWTTALSLSEVSGTNIDSVTVFGNAAGTLGTGINIIGGGGASIVTNIQRSSFFNVGTGISIGANAQGITIEGCNFTNGTTGISGAASVSGQTQLYVAGSQFNVLGDGIVINSAFGDLMFYGNLFLVA